MSLDDIKDPKHFTLEVSTDAATPYSQRYMEISTAFNSVHTVHRQALEKSKGVNM